MFSHLPDAAMVCYSKDTQGNYLFVNPAFLVHAQISSVGDLLGQKDRDLPWSNYATSMMENDAQIIKNGTTQIFLESGLYKGNFQWCRSFKSPFLGCHGKVLGIFGVSIPIQAKSLIPLTKQQTACLKHLAMGLTFKQIALALGLSPKTVEHYLDTVKIKLNCQSRSELVLQAIERGLANIF